MDAEGKVQHRGIGLEYAEFAGWSENEDFLGGRLREVLGVLIGMLQGIAHGGEPAGQRFFPLDTLVRPVAGKTVLRNIIHPLGANLHFHVGAILVLNGNVQALVAVGLGIGHPVPEALGIGLIFFRHEGIHAPAKVFLQLVIFPVAVYDKANGEHVKDTLEGHFLLHHFLPDGIGRLGAHLQFVLDAGVGELFLERFNKFRHQLLAVLLPRLQLIGNKAVLLRIGVLEIDVFHLPLHVVQTQLVSQRNVQQQRFQNLLVPAGLGEHLEASHHLQTVCQFEHRHARVPGILDNEFLIILRLQTGVLGLDGRNLVQAFHQGADSFSPFSLLYLHTGHAAGFVQVNGGDAFLREANLVGHYFGHGIRMADKRRPVVPGVVLQGFCSSRTGLIYEGSRSHVIGRWRAGAR